MGLGNIKVLCKCGRQSQGLEIDSQYRTCIDITHRSGIALGRSHQRVYFGISVNSEAEDGEIGRGIEQK